MKRFEQIEAWRNEAEETPAQRQDRYLENLARAEAFALKAPTRELQKAYGKLAETWNVLIENVEPLMQKYHKGD